MILSKHGRVRASLTSYKKCWADGENCAATRWVFELTIPLNVLTRLLDEHYTLLNNMYRYVTEFHAGVM
jgi:hypothetical protein